VNTETHSGTGMAITDAAHRASDDEQSHHRDAPPHQVADSAARPWSDGRPR